jgi:hypothetical protein
MDLSRDRLILELERLVNQGLSPDTGKRFFYSPQCPNWFRGPHNLLSNGYQGSFPGVKQLGHEADYSPLSDAEVENGAIPPLPHMSSWHGA